MATVHEYNLKEYVHSQYGTAGAWSHTTTYGKNDNNNNTFYIGGEDGHYRSRLYFTIPADLDITTSEKLIIKLHNYGQNDGKLWTLRTRAYLSTTNTPSSDTTHLSNLANPIMSYLYSDEAGQNRIIHGYSCPSGTTCHLIFNTTSLVAGQTYYIYITPYANDTDAPNKQSWTNTWMQWQNNPDSSRRLDAILYYTTTYTVSFSSNGGGVAPSPISVDKGSSITLPSAPLAPTGYYANAKIWGGEYGAGDTYTPTGNITLIAKWEPNPWQVKYNGNGATFGTMANSTHYYDTASSLSSNAFGRRYTLTFKDENGINIYSQNAQHFFKHWTLNANGTGTTYADGASVKNLTSTKNGIVNLYAQWQPVNFTFPTAPEREGYIFRGWSTSQGGDTVNQGGDIAVITANATYYAIYQEITAATGTLVYVKVNNQWLPSAK